MGLFEMARNEKEIEDCMVVIPDAGIRYQLEE